MVRLNITIPEDVAEQLNQVKNKSRFIAQAVQEKFEREQKERLIEEMIEGYQQPEDEEFLRDWDVTTPDGIDEEED